MSQLGQENIKHVEGKRMLDVTRISNSSNVIFQGSRGKGMQAIQIFDIVTALPYTSGWYNPCQSPM